METILLIHGFAASTDQAWIQNMKDLFIGKVKNYFSSLKPFIKTFSFLKADSNVILVDWREGAEAPNYIRARDNVVVTAKSLNQFIQKVKIDAKKIYCVGHSLGAQ